MPKEPPPHTCQREHTEVIGDTTAVDELMTLPASQRNPWRHICAACAFEKGFLAGIEYAIREHREAAHQTSERLTKIRSAVQSARLRG